MFGIPFYIWLLCICAELLRIGGPGSLPSQKDSETKRPCGVRDGGIVSAIGLGGCTDDREHAKEKVLWTHDRSNSASWGRIFGLKRNIVDPNPLYQQPDDEEVSKMPLLKAEKGSPESRIQKMFEDKKARREQRRSLRDSGDFLGVQGANPRTGYWDVSSGTSSSGPSQMSEETKKKLDEEAKNVEEQERRYEKAKAKHDAELSRVQTLRDNKKIEKEKRKKMELKMKQRRRGIWKLSEDGWHSLAEPELSPIIQSVAGSPGKGKVPQPFMTAFKPN